MSETIQQAPEHLEALAMPILGPNPMNSLHKATVIPRPTVDAADVGGLFHRLNNELGIILSHAELLEAKAADDISRSRAAQVVTSVLDAMGTARAIRARVNELMQE